MPARCVCDSAWPPRARRCCACSIETVSCGRSWAWPATARRSCSSSTRPRRRPGRCDDARGVGRAMTGWWAFAFVVLWLLVVVLCIVVIALARQVGTLHLRLGPRGALEIDDEGPALGEPLPSVDARAADGSSLVLGGPGRQIGRASCRERV